MSSDEDDVPNEIGFASAKTSAIDQREKEAKAAKDGKTQRKSNEKRKQAWFQESKGDGSLIKKKAESSRALTSVKPEEKKESNDLGDVEEEQSDLDDHFPEEEEFGESPSNISDLPQLSTLSKNNDAPEYMPLKDSAGNAVSVVPLKEKATSYRHDALKFAKDRFNPPQVYRLPASKTTSIAAKKRISRSSTKC